MTPSTDSPIRLQREHHRVTVETETELKWVKFSLPLSLCVCWCLFAGVCTFIDSPTCTCVSPNCLSEKVESGNFKESLLALAHEW